MMNLKEISGSISEEQLNIFTRIQSTIGLPLDFFGSVTRFDYFPGKSDIDIRVFSDTPQSTLFILKHMNLPHFERKVKRFYLALDKKHIIRGTKVTFISTSTTVADFDIVMFRSRDRARVLAYHHRESSMPWFLIAFLWVIKFLYYYLYFPPTLYHTLKNGAYNVYKGQQHVAIKTHIHDPS